MPLLSHLPRSHFWLSVSRHASFLTGQSRWLSATTGATPVSTGAGTEDFPTLYVNLREEEGSNRVKKLRREGLIPGVIHGLTKKHVLITTPQRALEKQLRERDGSFQNTVYKLVVEEDQSEHLVVPRCLQLHRTNFSPISCNFLSFDPEKGIRRLAIPVKFTDKDRCTDLKRGGYINTIYFFIKCRVKGTEIPGSLPLSLANKRIGSRIRWSELLKVMPPNITPIRPRVKFQGDLVIATILGKKSLMKQAEEEEAQAAREAEEA